MQDFHIHLFRLPNAESLGKELLESGIILNSIACEPWEWDRTLESLPHITQEIATFNKLQLAFGVHPMVANKTTHEDLERLESILESSRDYTVGECGLDKRFLGYEPEGIQEQILRQQVKLAKRLCRPLQIHCVGAYARILDILKEEEFDNQVTLHRFGGDIGIARAALHLLGKKVLFSLHLDSFRKRITVASMKAIPAEQIRFETDADESLTTEMVGSSDPKSWAGYIKTRLSHLSELYSVERPKLR